VGSISTRKVLLGIFALVVCLSLFTATAWAADPDVSLQRGPTPIANGSCIGANDITIDNGYLAISIAVDTVPPWGVPNGSILDGTTITGGWNAWPNTYQTVTIAEETTDKVVVEVARDYMKLKLVTSFTVTRGSKFVALKTVATNPVASGEDYTGIYCGYTFCTTGGFMFGPYGRSDSSVSDDYGKYVLGYDKDYSIGLHFPAANTYDGGSGWKDLYQMNTLAQGESRTFEGRVEFEDSASISRFVKAAADELGKSTGTVSGEITPNAGSFPEPPVLIVEKAGETFTWAVAEGGLFSLDLPAGDYDVYAVAKDFSPTAKVAVTVVAGESQTKDFAGLLPMSGLTVKVTQADSTKPVDARIKVTGGIAPVVGFLGKSVYFTDLNTIGTASFRVAAGDLILAVSSGDKFTSKAVSVPVTVVEGEDQTVPISIKTLSTPSRDRWFSADLHHHSDILDGVTAPEDLVRSQLAAKLDFTYVSDHDSFANNATISDISKTRGVPFISGDEISPIWAHFNVYPVSLTKPVTVDPAGTAEQIIDSAHAAGMLIAINHPYIAYGYFNAADQDTIPGGYCPDFDLIEIQSTGADKGTSPDERTLARTYTLWNGNLTGENKKYYLTGGYDMHDVWSNDYLSGGIRTFVRIPAPLAKTQTNYLAGLKAGHSYITMGPLVQPLDGLQFGDTLTVKKSSARVTFSLNTAAAYGLKSVKLLREGKVVRTLSFDDDTTNDRVVFSVGNSAKSWYCFIVEDTLGNRAITNPVWTRMAN
jgi:hypothetical protein